MQDRVSGCHKMNVCHHPLAGSTLGFLAMRAGMFPFRFPSGYSLGANACTSRHFYNAVSLDNASDHRTIFPTGSANRIFQEQRGELFHSSQRANAYSWPTLVFFSTSVLLITYYNFFLKKIWPFRNITLWKVNSTKHLLFNSHAAAAVIKTRERRNFNFLIRVMIWYLYFFVIGEWDWSDLGVIHGEKNLSMWMDGCILNLN